MKIFAIVILITFGLLYLHLTQSMTCVGKYPVYEVKYQKEIYDVKSEIELGLR